MRMATSSSFRNGVGARIVGIALEAGHEDVVAHVRPPPRGERVEGGAERVDVGGGARHLPAQDLRREEGRTADELRRASRIGLGKGEAEIENPERPVLVEDEIRGLEVPVQDALRVGGGDAARGLHEPAPPVLLHPLGFLLDELLQVRPLEILHREVQASEALAVVIERDDVWMLERRDGPSLAFEVAHRRHVALKILPWQLRGDETAMRYFKREARAIAALKHPNIVALYDYGEGFGSLYLAMEYLEGPHMQKLITKATERVEKNWRSWFVQAARGIAAAHAKGILHRDLKPANLILDEHGTLRILDFGLALPQADAGGTSKLIGSPAFFPPEVLRGEMPSPASDVYSLGAAFYTLATGRWPYIGDDVLVARLERDPDDPRPYAVSEGRRGRHPHEIARAPPTGPLPGRRRAARCAS